MEINRNQYFMAGLIVLLLGVQFRYVETYVLTEEAAKAIAKQGGDASADASGGGAAIQSASSAPNRNITPPVWVGWAFISLGAVLILHSLAMPRPG